MTAEPRMEPGSPGRPLAAARRRRSSLLAPSADPDVLDVAACARLLGMTEKAIRARVHRRQLPFRRLGGRILFLRSELMAYLDALPGVRPADTLLEEPIGFRSS